MRCERLSIGRIAESAIVLVTLLGLSVVAQAQTYTVLHNFTGGADGANPRAGVTLDQGGNLYGTTSAGGYTGGRCTVGRLNGCGTVFKLGHTNSGWVLNPLYTFMGQYGDGASPFARVIFGPDGTLYGTTAFGGPADSDCFSVGCGTVFNLKPPATACKTALCPWRETVLYFFQLNLNLGGNPWLGDLLFDHSGNVYGTTWDSAQGDGEIFELLASSGGWTYNTLYQFPVGYRQGGDPNAGVISDGTGNLYGTAMVGPHYAGIIYRLSPSGSGWSSQILYAFQGGSDGANPAGGLVFDQSGNLYGTTLSNGAGGGGTVYELSPSDSGWVLTTLHSFSGTDGSYAVLAMDASGNLYGTTFGDGAYGYGNVFKLTNSNGNWSYTSLYDFTGGTDGGQPYGQVALDANGNLYGTASAGGTNGHGVVWEIMP